MNKKKQDRYLLVVVEESANRLGLYDSSTLSPAGHIALSLWPHEVAVASDGLAYVSNFGIRDYDLSLGHAGNSVSVVDLENRCEVGRLYTHFNESHFWGPHGVKLSPTEDEVLVNVERVVGVRQPDLERPGSEHTKLLRFNRRNGRCVAAVEIGPPTYDRRGFPVSKFEDPTAAYDVLPGTHNFVFSPKDPMEVWLFSGRQGVSVLNLNTGKITARLRDFSGSVRALSFGEKTGVLLVCSTNEVSLVNAEKREVVWRLGDLGVGQLLYGKLTPDEKHIIVPAVWEGQVLVINVASGKVEHRLNTGVDPVQVEIAPDKRRAYVTHGRSRWLSFIELSDLGRVAGRVNTQGGPNGLAFAPYSVEPAAEPLTVLAALPFTGPEAAAGREIRLGCQFWKDLVNESGGLFFDGRKRRLEVEYVDTESSVAETELRELLRAAVSEHSPLAVLGSYPRAANRWLGLECNELKLPFVSGLDAPDSLFGDDREYNCNLAAMRTCVSEGVLLAVANNVSPSPRTIGFLVANSPEYIDEAEVTADAARALGFDLLLGSEGEFASFAVGGSGLPAAAATLRTRTPDLLIVVAGIADSSLALRVLADTGVKPGGIAVTCGVTNAVFQARAGKLVDGLLGGTDWSTGTSIFAEDRVGASADFARSYFQRYSEQPSSFAAAGAATLGAIERAAALATAPARLARTLRSLDYESFYGKVQINGQGRNEGRRLGAVQLSVSYSGKILEREIWPSGPTVERPKWPAG